MNGTVIVAFFAHIFIASLTAFFLNLDISHIIAFAALFHALDNKYGDTND